MLEETNAFVTIFEEYYFHVYFKRMIEESIAIIQLNLVTFRKSFDHVLTFHKLWSYALPKRKEIIRKTKTNWTYNVTKVQTWCINNF